MSKNKFTWGLLVFALTGCQFFTADKNNGPAPTTTESGDPRIAQESPAIAQISSNLQQALKSGNVEAALSQFAPELKTDYEKAFTTMEPEKRAKLAEALAGAQVTSIDPGSVRADTLAAELTVALDGRTFHVEMVKRDGKWLFNSL